MNEDGELYAAYMLRIWQTTRNGNFEVWLSLENPHTGERYNFTSLENLNAFLAGYSACLSEKWEQKN
jgi:hypothetical protein